MPDQNATDLVMKFIFEGKPVWAECALEIDPKDTMMKDFGQNTGYDNYADFFEVSGFDFGISLKEDDESPTGPSVTQPNRTQHGGQGGQQGQQRPAKMPFQRWRSAVGQEYKKIFYPLEFDDFNFERTIDAASPIFFQCCCKSKTFDSATMVKRISQGDTGQSDDSSRPQFGFLRIDFDKVLITSIGWDDGDVVKEKVSFICQKMTIKYRQQRADGLVLAGTEVKAVWPNPNNDRSLNIRSGGRP